MQLHEDQLVRLDVELRAKQTCQLPVLLNELLNFGMVMYIGQSKEEEKWFLDLLPSWLMKSQIILLTKQRAKPGKNENRHL